jgi:hypothetical protein
MKTKHPSLILQMAAMSEATETVLVEGGVGETPTPEEQVRLIISWVGVLVTRLFYVESGSRRKGQAFSDLLTFSGSVSSTVT